MQAPLDQAEKRVQAAFTQPVSVVFQNMSDSVKAIHLLPRSESQSILINGSTFRMDYIIHITILHKLHQLNYHLSKHLLNTFLCICVLGQEDKIRRAGPVLSKRSPFSESNLYGKINLSALWYKQFFHSTVT